MPIRPLLCALLITCSALRAQSFNGRSASDWVTDFAAADEDTRDYAIWALCHMGDRAVRATQRALDDERAGVRRAAAVTLGRLGKVAAGASDRLTKLCEDPDPTVANAAKVASMRVRVNGDELPRLIAALDADDWELVLAAAQVLEQLGEKAAPAAPALVTLLLEEDDLLDRTIVRKLKTANTQHWNVRESTALALGAIGPVEGVRSVDALVHTLGNREWAAREGAVRALAAFAADAATTVPKLLAVVKDDDTWSCRREAVESITRLVPKGSPLLPDVVKAMADALEDSDGGVCRLAAEFLGARGEASIAAVPTLSVVLRSPNYQHRVYAADALRGLGPAAAGAKDVLVAAYESLAGSKKRGAGDAQRAILEALAVVAPEARKTLPELEELLAKREKPAPSADARRHDRIIAALADLQSSEGAKRRKAIAAAEALRATEAIPSLKECLAEDRPAKERAAAIDALTMLDAEDIVPMVRPLLQHEAHELRLAAATALAMFEDKESVQEIASVLAETCKTASKDQLWFLGLMGVKELAPALEAIVADPKETHLRRWGATMALNLLAVQTSGPVVTAMIERVASDPDMEGREKSDLLTVALQALHSIDAKANKTTFAKYVDADELEVRNAALAGLASLGDPSARAELRRQEPASTTQFEVPEEVCERLAACRLRLSQVKGCRLRDVLPRIEAQLGKPIDVSAVNAATLDGRFHGYVDFLGFHPSALSVLTSMSPHLFSGGALELRFVNDRIVLTPPTPK